jgi:hypothetical protein
MLKNIWDKAVKFYHGQCQASDATMIANIDHRINNARQGFMEHMIIGARTGYCTLRRTPLSPQEAEKFIEREQRDRDALVRRMEQRREKHGLKL